MALPNLPQFSNRPFGSSIGFVPGQAAQREAMATSGQSKADT